MSESRRAEPIDFWSDFRNVAGELGVAITRCDDRAMLGRRNSKILQEARQKKVDLEEELENIRNTANHMNRMYKNILKFKEDKQKMSKEVLELAIQEAGMLVPDANLQNATLLHENGRAAVLDSRGQNINEREGGAARTITGLLIKYAEIKAQPDKLQLILLDEALFALSENTTYNMQSTLVKMSENVGICCIEQKDTMFRGLDKRVYRAVKTGDFTQIKEER